MRIACSIHYVDKAFVEALVERLVERLVELLQSFAWRFV
jgi:hypothetical protein